MLSIYSTRRYLPKRNKTKHPHKNLQHKCLYNNILVVILNAQVGRNEGLHPERPKKSFVVIEIFCILSMTVFPEYTHLSKVNKLCILSSCSFCMKVTPRSSLNKQITPAQESTHPSMSPCSVPLNYLQVTKVLGL